VRVGTMSVVVPDAVGDLILDLTCTYPVDGAPATATNRYPTTLRAT